MRDTNNSFKNKDRSVFKKTGIPISSNNNQTNESNFNECEENLLRSASDIYQNTNKSDIYQNTNKSDIYQNTNKSDIYQNTNKSDIYQNTNKSDIYQNTNKSDIYQNTNKSDIYQNTNKSDIYQNTNNSDIYQNTNKNKTNIHQNINKDNEQYSNKNKSLPSYDNQKNKNIQNRGLNVNETNLNFLKDFSENTIKRIEKQHLNKKEIQFYHDKIRNSDIKKSKDTFPTETIKSNVSDNQTFKIEGNTILEVGTNLINSNNSKTSENLIMNNFSVVDQNDSNL